MYQTTGTWYMILYVFNGFSVKLIELCCFVCFAPYGLCPWNITVHNISYSELQKTKLWSVSWNVEFRIILFPGCVISTLDYLMLAIEDGTLYKMSWLRRPFLELLISCIHKIRLIRVNIKNENWDESEVLWTSFWSICVYVHI